MDNGNLSASASAPAGILRPPSADLALETTPEDDPMVEHMHLHVSPSRGEVHAHGRWHKYVKPRIGPGFQVRSDAIPDLLGGDGLPLAGGTSASTGGEDDDDNDGREKQPKSQRKGSAADLSSAEEGSGTGAAAGTRRSGRSSARSRSRSGSTASRSGSGRSTPTHPDECEF